MPRLVLVAALGLTLVVAAGISATRDSPAAAPAPGPPPKVETTRCPADARAIETQATCGHVVLPLDREKPAGKTIRVAGSGVSDVKVGGKAVTVTPYVAPAV